MFSQAPRGANVRATTFALIYSLHRQKLDALLDKYEPLRLSLEAVARERGALKPNQESAKEAEAPCAADSAEGGAARSGSPALAAAVARMERGLEARRVAMATRQVGCRSRPPLHAPFLCIPLHLTPRPPARPAQASCSRTIKAVRGSLERQQRTLASLTAGVADLVDTAARARAPAAAGAA